MNNIFSSRPPTKTIFDYLPVQSNQSQLNISTRAAPETAAVQSPYSKMDSYSLPFVATSPIRHQTDQGNGDNSQRNLKTWPACAMWTMRCDVGTFRPFFPVSDLRNLLFDLTIGPVLVDLLSNWCWVLANGSAVMMCCLPEKFSM